MENVILTGASGFIGKHMLNFLKSEKVNLTILGRSKNPVKIKPINTNYIKWDGINLEELKNAIKLTQPDIFINLAGFSSPFLSWVNPKDVFQVNIILPQIIMNALVDEAPGCKLLLIGSGDEYAENLLHDKPIIEEDKLNPKNPYSISKVALGALAKAYVDRFNLKIVKTRSFSHIGPGQSTKFALPKFAKTIMKKRKSKDDNTLHVGNLATIRTFLDVRDAVEAYWLLVHNFKSGQSYNVAGVNTLSIAEVLNMMIKISGKKVNIIEDKKLYKPLDMKFQIPSIEKIKKLTGWGPKIDLEMTVKDILEYYEK